MNIVGLSGRLTADPEVRTTQSGKSVCSFSIANETGFGDKKKTNFINCVAWEKRAELIGTHYCKGNRIVLSGELQSRGWEDKEGHKRNAVEVIVSEIVFIDAPAPFPTPEAKSNEETPLIASDFEEFETADDGDLPF